MHVFITSANEWLDPYIKRTIQRHIPDATFHSSIATIPDDAHSTIQICNGWHLNPHFSVHNNSSSRSLLNAYPSSDALSRKDHLARIAEYWIAKRPFSPLAKHWPATVRLSLDYADFVEESLAAADDLSCLYSLEDNEAKEARDREWWILKPALMDCGAGIRIFSTADELAACLEEAESENSCGSSEEGGYEEPTPTLAGSYKPALENGEARGSPLLNLSTPGLDALDGLVTATGQLKINIPTSKAAVERSQAWLTDPTVRIPSASLREFVAQRYIVNIPSVEGRKWHVRAYVLCLGRLKVYVYREMLALLAKEPYQPPWEQPSLQSSLTNTSLQSGGEVDELSSMRRFEDLPDDLIPRVRDWKNSVFDQICEVSGEVVCAAAHTMVDKFTPLDRCFELFAVDFLVDGSGTAWLLEVNETPAFYQAGIAGDLSTRLMDSVVSMALTHIGYEAENGNEIRGRLREVLDESKHLGKSNITMIIPE